MTLSDLEWPFHTSSTLKSTLSASRAISAAAGLLVLIGEVISIDMSEFPVAVICAVLTFVYTNELEITNETVGPLLKCADELGICVIVDMCIDYLGHVSTDTAIMFYSIAENYDLSDIKECIYRFIIDNFSEVRKRHTHRTRNK